MRLRWTGAVCDTSSSDSHSGQVKISPSSTSSSSTSISVEHLGQRITAPSSVGFFARRVGPSCRLGAAYYIPHGTKSRLEVGTLADNVTAGGGGRKAGAGA